MSKPHLFLAGFRGTGKSTVATLISKVLQLPLIDLDTEITRLSGQPIADIFRSLGEPAFRELETESLRRAVKATPSVISLGGGAILSPGNRNSIKQTGKCVWLTASPETIAERLAADQQSGSQRPALTQLSPLEEIRQLLRAREPLYREVADWTVDTDGRSPEQVASWVLSNLNDSFPTSFPNT